MATITNIASRVMDIEQKTSCSPVVGLKDAPLLSLRESIDHAGSRDPVIQEFALGGHIFVALLFAEELIQQGEKVLSLDEVAAIHIYTQESNLYKDLNRRLRTSDRRTLVPYFPYLKLLLGALYKLPVYTGKALRGVRKDLHGLFVEGQRVIWWGFSSMTNLASVLENEMFLGQSGERTMLDIAVLSGVDIRKYSAIQSESEILLLPGTCVQVTSKLALGNGLHMLQMQELETEPLLDFFRPKTAATMMSSLSLHDPKPASLQAIPTVSSIGGATTEVARFIDINLAQTLDETKRRALVELLNREDVTSLTVLRSLTPEDLKAIGVPLGSQKALSLALASSPTAAAPAPALAEDAESTYRKACKLFYEPPFDIAKSRELCERAAAQGHAGAKGLLSDFFFYGLGGAKDQNKAYQLASEASAAGDHWGQLILGTCYGHGAGGVTRDDRSALRLYEAAAAQGNGSAMLGIAYMYDMGAGPIAKDTSKAREWFVKASRQTEPIWANSRKAAQEKLDTM